MRSQVPQGEKPILELTGVQAVTSLTIDLARGDGKKFSVRPGAIAAGQVVTVPIGDGAPGKATYKCTFSAVLAGGQKWTDTVEFETAVTLPIKFQYDVDHLDLDKRVLQFKVSRPIDKASLVVIGEDGKELGKGDAAYADKLPADGWLPIGWTQPAGARVLTLKLRAVASDGAVALLDLTPWSFEVEHEDVNFATDSATIDPGETAKLDASLAKIAETMKRVTVVKMQLYVAGHTDTVGPNDKNLRLSQARALAIAKYFRSKGLAIPIAVAGYGEEVLKVHSGQDKDERANRRADYVLGPAGGTPPFRGAYNKFRASWSVLK
ncbi:MAG: OmpA family protein [Deltaproteobacteria bacterium]|nr:OmpA family protein [Deltaproteobacteria bacterium]